jgi:hypothetical protein
MNRFVRITIHGPDRASARRNRCMVLKGGNNKAVEAPLIRGGTSDLCLLPRLS